MSSYFEAPFRSALIACGLMFLGNFDGRIWEDGGTLNRRVWRGGSWYFTGLNCRVACRYWLMRGNWNDSLGFRVVCVFSSRALP